MACINANPHDACSAGSSSNITPMIYPARAGKGPNDLNPPHVPNYCLRLTRGAF